MKKLMILLCAAMMPLSSGAQAAAESSPTPPNPPLLKPALAGAQWVVTRKAEAKPSSSSGGEKHKTSKRKEAKPNPTRTATAKVVKGENSAFEVTVNENGFTMRTWYFAGRWMSSMDGKTWTEIPPRAQTFDAPDYARQDFAGFDWISEKNFSGSQEFEGSPCFEFKDRVVTLSPAEIDLIKSNISRDFTDVRLSAEGIPLSTPGESTANKKHFDIDDYKSDVTAYINRDTRLPVALVYETPMAKISRTYRFEEGEHPILTPLDAGAQTENKDRAVNELNKGSIK
jgi:hypothetical protein